jgi:hypothetical protein
VPAAVVLALLAVDVLRMPAALEQNDVRFDAAPRRQAGLWQGLGLLPGRPAERLLGLEEDLAYRRAMAMFLRVQPGKVQIYGPELENLRGRVQLELGLLSAADTNPKRRGQYLNLLGAMSLERYSSITFEAESILRRSVHTFRGAVETDPENADAKLNLELALRNAKAVELTGTDPDTGAAQGTEPGQGGPGGGY